MATWLGEALAWLPLPVRRERLALLRGQLVGTFGQRAELLDAAAPPPHLPSDELFLEDLLDVLVAGLAVAPSPAALAALSSDDASSNDRH